MPGGQSGGGVCHRWIRTRLTFREVDPSMAARNHIDLTVKTMSVLESLVESGEGASLKDVAARVGLIKSSVFRILFTLKELGYVEQVKDSGRYRLTFKT